MLFYRVMMFLGLLTLINNIAEGCSNHKGIRVNLPLPADDVQYGPEAKSLVFTFRDILKVGVYDLETLKFTRYITLDSAQDIVRVSSNGIVICSPSNQTLRRYPIKAGELEVLRLFEAGKILDLQVLGAKDDTIVFYQQATSQIEGAKKKTSIGLVDYKKKNMKSLQLVDEKQLVRASRFNEGRLQSIYQVGKDAPVIKFNTSLRQYRLSIDDTAGEVLLDYENDMKSYNFISQRTLRKYPKFGFNNEDTLMIESINGSNGFINHYDKEGKLKKKIKTNFTSSELFYPFDPFVCQKLNCYVIYSAREQFIQIYKLKEQSKSIKVLVNLKDGWSVDSSLLEAHLTFDKQKGELVWHTATKPMVSRKEYVILPLVNLSGETDFHTQLVENK